MPESAALSTTPRAVVAGAGPVGCLAAIALAKQGWTVDIYEGRPDMRTPGARAASQQRSINLALSSRGITALQAVLGQTAAAEVLQDAIPMSGRMIHHTNGRLQSQAYDRHGQCINSLDRAILNEMLLSRAVDTPGIRVHFKHKVAAIDFERRVMTLADLEGGRDIQAAFDLCIGADGSYSVVRRQLQRVVRMDYQQTYIPHEYVELKMPATIDSDGHPVFRMDPNHLHIWPRHSFMLIALPNKDKSFTCTLFAPTETFDQLSSSTREERRTWFQTQFPDALDLIGTDLLLDDLERNPRSALISIKANPYHYKDCAILLGDAAHAMVPFYGQGLNCGLEDVRVLNSLLRKNGVFRASEDPDILAVKMNAALMEYSTTRHEDLVAICDLAMDNYTEMRHAVTTPSYLFRKAVDNVLEALTSSAPSSHAPKVIDSPGPSADLTYTAPVGEDPEPAFMAEPFGWLPLYSMVTFQPRMGYASARRKAQAQMRVLKTIEGAVLFGTATALIWAGWSARRRWL